MNKYDAAWIAWGAGFIVIEGLALKNGRPGDTLSEKVWDTFATKRQMPGQPVTRDRSGWEQARRFTLVAGMTWLTVHFVSGGWV